MARAHPILVPTDFTSGADQALTEGLRWARRLGAPLHLIHVVRDRSTTTHPIQRTWLLEQLALHDLQDINARPVLLYRQGVSQAIVEYAERTKAEMIVMGTPGRMWLAPPISWSHTAYVVRHAPCSVLAVREANEALLRDGRLNRVLVVLDAIDADIPLLHKATQLARMHRADLHVLLHSDKHAHAAAPSAFARSEEQEAHAARNIRHVHALLSTESLTLPSRVHTSEGSLTEAVTMTARDGSVDLVLMKQPERLLEGDQQALLDCEHVIRQAPCPVLAANISQGFPQYQRRITRSWQRATGKTKQPPSTKGFLQAE